jgi:hypothetical protein
MAAMAERPVSMSSARVVREKAIAICPLENSALGINVLSGRIIP